VTFLVILVTFLVILVTFLVILVVTFLVIPVTFLVTSRWPTVAHAPHVIGGLRHVRTASDTGGMALGLRGVSVARRGQAMGLSEQAREALQNAGRLVKTIETTTEPHRGTGDGTSRADRENARAERKARLDEAMAAQEDLRSALEHLSDARSGADGPTESQLTAMHLGEVAAAEARKRLATAKAEYDAAVDAFVAAAAGVAEAEDAQAYQAEMVDVWRDTVRVRLARARESWRRVGKNRRQKNRTPGLYARARKSIED
jgi:hypothetical protein